MTVERNYLIHPYYILITLLLASITALFLGFSGAYLYSRIQSGELPIQIPNLFYFNTIILMASSLTMIMAKKYYRNDLTQRFQFMLLATIVITVLFLIFQVFAWVQLHNLNLSITDGNMASYLYVISALHFFHVIAGVPFLCIFLITAIKKMKEPVSVLVYFSDPDKKRKLDIITIYWHFLDILWIYLVLFFLVNLLIK